MLGGIDGSEAASVLKLASDSGLRLVDTSSAYGLSETVIGAADHSLAVATKFGNPCELNGHTHDYSTEHCQDPNHTTFLPPSDPANPPEPLQAAVAQSLRALHRHPALGGPRRLTCLQLHSPPECPSPLEDPPCRHTVPSLIAGCIQDPTLLRCLHQLKLDRHIEAWGASVHTVDGGCIVLQAGADMLQVPFNLLQQVLPQ